MKNTFDFIPSAEEARRQPVRREIYEQSVDLYNEGKHLEGISLPFGLSE